MSTNYARGCNDRLSFTVYIKLSNVNYIQVYYVVVIVSSSMWWWVVVAVVVVGNISSTNSSLLRCEIHNEYLGKRPLPRQCGTLSPATSTGLPSVLLQGCVISEPPFVIR